jgi:hypothetical protein
VPTPSQNLQSRHNAKIQLTFSMVIAKYRMEHLIGAIVIIFPDFANG